MSISSQSRASIATKYGLDTFQTQQRITAFLKLQLGVDYVFDVSFAHDLSLLESAAEFLHRIKTSSATPMLASACPGWVCYAEKTHGDLLSLLDSTKSAMQIMGSLLKNCLSTKLGISPNDVYHVSIAPCYDKKLEASRQDFYSDLYRTRDVDCVLTTGELESMFTENGSSIATTKEAPLDSLFTKSTDTTRFLCRAEGNSSGGYLPYVLRSAVSSLYGVSLTLSDITGGTNGVAIVPGRNQDYTEVLYTPPGATEPALRFAYAYGFRNIQNLVRRLKPTNKPVNPRRTRPTTESMAYHFIEVMACPSGCINGGGQLKPQDASNAKQWIVDSEATYQQSDAFVQKPEDNDGINSLYREWLGGRVRCDRAIELLHTEYHAVDSSEPSVMVSSW